MRASIFIATSVDGFIARENGALDWLPADGGEPHGYIEFMATVDALVMERAGPERIRDTRLTPAASARVKVFFGRGEERNQCTVTPI